MPSASDYQITKASLFFENKRNLILTIAAEGTPSGDSIDTSSGNVQRDTDKAVDKIASDTDKAVDKITSDADKTLKKLKKLFK